MIWPSSLRGQFKYSHNAKKMDLSIIVRTFAPHNAHKHKCTYLLDILRLFVSIRNWSRTQTLTCHFHCLSLISGTFFRLNLSETCLWSRQVVTCVSIFTLQVPACFRVENIKHRSCMWHRGADDECDGSWPIWLVPPTWLRNEEDKVALTCGLMERYAATELAVLLLHSSLKCFSRSLPSFSPSYHLDTSLFGVNAKPCMLWIKHTAVIMIQVVIMIATWSIKWWDYQLLIL